MSSCAYTCELSDIIKFNTDEPIRVSDIVKSLQSLEKILKQSNKTFSKLTDSEVDDIELLIQSVEKGSLKEHIIVKFLFKNQENLDKFLEKSHDYIVEQCKGHPVRSSLVGIAISGLVAYGFYNLGSQSDTDKVTISGNYNTVIVNGAGQLNITEKAFKEAIEANKQNKKSLTRNAVEFAQVAKSNDKNASITFGDDDKNITISEDVIKAIPLKAPKVEIEEKIQIMPEVTLSIRTVDRDNHEGWTAYIDGFFEKRVKLIIPINIQLNQLSKQEKIKADVKLYYKPKAKGDGINPISIELTKIYTEKPTAKK